MKTAKHLVSEKTCTLIIAFLTHDMSCEMHLRRKKHQRPNNTYRTDIAEEDNGLRPENSVVLHIEHTLNRFISTAQKITGQIFLRRFCAIVFCAVKTDLYQLARFSTPHIEQLCSNSYKLQTCIL